MRKADRELGMDRPITRRDFINGVSVAVGASLVPAARAAAANAATPQAGAAPDAAYPPARTGLRGSHPGSYEVAHSMRDGRTYDTGEDTGERYDLVVVGGGMSGLAAAYYFRKRTVPNAKILVLDNHDDFGGHARRNEFLVDGRLLIARGGTSYIERPATFPVEGRELLKDIGIDYNEPTYKIDRGLYASLGLRTAQYFDQETFGINKLVMNPPGVGGGGGGGGAARGPSPEFLAQTPLTPRVQQELLRLYTDRVDYLPGLSKAEKLQKLRKLSYTQYLLDIVKVDPEVLAYYHPGGNACPSLTIDTASAWFFMNHNGAGFGGLGLALEVDAGSELDEHPPVPDLPTQFHFPEGVGGVARLLVRSLIPEALPVKSMADGELTRVDYARLDASSSSVRIRLSSTVVRVRNVGDPKAATEADVVYVRDGKALQVRAKGVVLACHHGVIPYVCPELPAAQKEALHLAVRATQMITNVAIRNWKAFEKMGVSSVSCPGAKYPGYSSAALIAAGLDGRVQAGADAGRADRRRVERRHGRHGAEIGHERARHVPRRAQRHVSDAVRGLRAQHQDAPGARLRRRRVRPGPRHRGADDQSLAARLRDRRELPVRSRLVRGRTALRQGAPAVRPHYHRQHRRRGHLLDPGRIRPGVPRRQRARQAADGVLESIVGLRLPSRTDGFTLALAPRSMHDLAVRWLAVVAITLAAAAASAQPAPVSGSSVPQRTSSELPVGYDGPPPPALPAVIARDKSDRVTVRAVRIAEPLRLDGRLDEAIYSTVQPMSDFIQVEPQGGAQASEQTEAWVLYDDDNLYVAVRAADSQPDRMVANEMRRDSNNIYSNEYIGIALDTFYDRRNAYYFATTPLGGRGDGQITNEKQYNGDLNPIWDVHVGRFDGGWTAEFAIPFKSLRYRPGRAQIWGFNVERMTKWKNELSFLTRLPIAMGQRAFFQISAAATMVGIEAPRSRNLELKPYITSNLTTDVTATPRLSNDIGGDAGSICATASPRTCPRSSATTPTSPRSKPMSSRST